MPQRSTPTVVVATVVVLSLGVVDPFLLWGVVMRHVVTRGVVVSLRVGLELMVLHGRVVRGVLVRVVLDLAAFHLGLGTHRQGVGLGTLSVDYAKGHNDQNNASNHNKGWVPEKQRKKYMVDSWLTALQLHRYLSSLCVLAVTIGSKIQTLPIFYLITDSIWD